MVEYRWQVVNLHGRLSCTRCPKTPRGQCLCDEGQSICSHLSLWQHKNYAIQTPVDWRIYGTFVMSLLESAETSETSEGWFAMLVTLQKIDNTEDWQPHQQKCLRTFLVSRHLAAHFLFSWTRRNHVRSRQWPEITILFVSQLWNWQKEKQKRWFFCGFLGSLVSSLTADNHTGTISEATKKTFLSFYACFMEWYALFPKESCLCGFEFVSVFVVCVCSQNLSSFRAKPSSHFFKKMRHTKSTSDLFKTPDA